MLIQRALLSVSNKEGIVELAKALAAQNIELIATGGTYHTIKAAGVSVEEVSHYTGFPEMLNGRLKTLHPKIHGGLLAQHPKDEAACLEHHLPYIDLVIVNLYPFKETIASKHVTETDAIEQIDIGGPTLIRAAAKNHERVTVCVSPHDYQPLINHIQTTGHVPLATRKALAAKAFSHTAQYDAIIANYLIEKETPPKQLPLQCHLSFQKNDQQALRYGENPHQIASLYHETSKPSHKGLNTPPLQGKSLSFNNLLDADTALKCVMTLKDPACVIVKHATPCGCAIHPSIHDAYQMAYACDPTSAFGGIIAFNRALDEQTALAIIKQQFVEVVIAPSFTPEALAHFKTKPNCRVLAIDDFDPNETYLDIRAIYGGYLIQKDSPETDAKWNVVSQRLPMPEEIQDLAFSWKVVKWIKSNAIVYAKNNQTIGIGSGQMSRIFSAEIGLQKATTAGFSLQGAVMASDAFFPFRDSVDTAAKQGITAIIQPGGSKRDEEVIAAANEHNIALIFTEQRLFRH